MARTPESLVRVCVLVLVGWMAGCTHPPELSDADRLLAIEHFRADLSDALKERGPVAWLDYFEDSESFFMGSDGAVVFPSIDSARVFVDRLSETLTSIELTWVAPRTTLHSDGIATLVSEYHESILQTSGDSVSFGGLVSMLLVDTDNGIRIRNLHWSSPVNPAPRETQ